LTEIIVVGFSSYLPTVKKEELICGKRQAKVKIPTLRKETRKDAAPSWAVGYL
jgi:hypothetical protein